MNQSSYTPAEQKDRARSLARVKDQLLIGRIFTQDDYICEMHIFSDNQSHIKFGKRSMFGWIDVRQMGDEETIKLSYTMTVDMNDWDISPRYVEHGLLGKLDMLIRQRKKQQS